MFGKVGVVNDWFSFQVDPSVEVQSEKSPPETTNFRGNYEEEEEKMRGSTERESPQNFLF